MSCDEMSVTNYQPTLHNIAEERRSQQRRGKRLKFTGAHQLLGNINFWGISTSGAHQLLVYADDVIIMGEEEIAGLNSKFR
jgi:hypothetical protein